MCDICGCPLIEPFASLIAEHEALFDAAAGGDAGRLRSLWLDHAPRERGSLSPLIRSADAEEITPQLQAADAEVEAAISAGDLSRAFRALQDHAGVYEYELFPYLAFAADDDALGEASRRLAEAGRH